MPDNAALRRAHWTGWRPTREGRLWLVVVALLLAVGIVKNINLVALLGYVLLAVVGLASVVAGRRLRRLEARRVLDETIFAGCPTRLEVRLLNPSPYRVQGVRLEDIGPSHSASWYFDAVEPGGRRAAFAEFTPPARGWYDMAPLTASGSHPFGLWQRRVLVGLPARVLALPRPGKIHRDRLRQHLRGADPRGERVRRHGWRHEAAQADFHGLRPFRPGDSPRWIHWRTSARRGQLMVREFEDVPGDDLVLVLDGAESSDLIEDILSLAATVIWEWNQRRGDRFVMAVGGERPELLDGTTSPDHARALLERLALLPKFSLLPSPASLLAGGVPTTAAVAVVATDDTGLVAELESITHRPVALFTPEGLRQAGVYTPP